MNAPSRRTTWLVLLLSLVLPLALRAAAARPATASEAKAFVQRTNQELRKLFIRQATAEWIKTTYITDDTERNAAAVGTEVLAYLAVAQKEAARLAKAPSLDATTARALHLVRLVTPSPAPDRPAAREEMATVGARLEGLYGKAKGCGPEGKPPCRALNELEDTLAKSRDPAALLTAWRGWHDAARPTRPLYTRLVALGNEGARELGFADLGELWLSGYDLKPAEVRKEVDRLYEQLEPLYRELHCYARGRLSKRYGTSVVPATGPIPAHVLGNMWAQEWGEVYALLEPFPGQTSLDLGKVLQAQGYDANRMTRTAESFFTSLGLAPLPATFWERSMFTKPRDRDVVCHASAWDVLLENDLRIKMCIQPEERDLVTLHHELGHLYYYQAYGALPVLFQAGANDGFHEAIGDAISLSVTPSYLKQIGLLKEAATGEKALINQQLKDALERVAFLPFGRVVDQWRWDVFSGKIPPERYNTAWWELRRKYQGVVPPVARTETDFDPGAKYHVPANVPYLRYFFARVLQFQFHRGLCRAAGFQGPLHACSIFGSKEAGRKLQSMLELGASRPWPEALAVLTGERTMDASAMIEYFAPLRAWLAEQNRGQTCGW